MKKVFTLTVILLGLNACSTVDFSDRNDLQGDPEYLGLIDEITFTGYQQPRTIKTLGRLRVNNTFSKTNPEGDHGTTFMLKREKQRFYAETMLFTSDNKDKTFFDESSFNIGMDRKKKIMGMEVSFKF